MSAMNNAIIVGGTPRIDFLPPEIRQKKLLRRNLRGLVTLAVLVLGVCIAAYAGVTALTIASQAGLASALGRTQALLAEQGEYSEARTVSRTLTAVTNARLVGSANEVLWVEYLDKVALTLPAGAFLTSITVDSSSATEPPPEPASIAEAPRRGTIILGGRFPTIASIASWLETLNDLPGHAEYSASGVSIDDAGRYAVDVAIHVNEGAFARRYFAPEDDGAAVNDSEAQASPADENQE